MDFPSGHHTGSPLYCGPKVMRVLVWRARSTTQMSARPLVSMATANLLPSGESLVVEQAIETAALMLGSDKSRGYCLEMICADFLAGANLENGNSQVLLQSILRFFKFLPGEEREDVSGSLQREGVMNGAEPKRPRLRLDPELYEELRNQVLRRDGWRCQACGTMSNLEVHHKEFRSHSGDDSDQNLITICAACHAEIHEGDGLKGICV